MELYASTNKEYLENRTIVFNAIKKFKREAFIEYMREGTITVVVKKEVIVSELIASNIIDISPKSAIYMLEYMRFNYGSLQDNSVNIEIKQKNRQVSQFVDFVEILIILIIYTRNKKINIKLIDDEFKALMSRVKKAKITIIGTLMGIRLPIFERKKNTIDREFTYEELRGDGMKQAKNHLLPDPDLLLDVSCPVCTDKKRFFYSDIKKHMKYKNGEIVIICNHSGSEHEYKAPFRFCIPSRVEIPKKIEELFMYFIQNNKYYEI